MTNLSEDSELKERIMKFLATIYLNKKITISEAQSILGDSANADSLIKGMLEKKTLMKSTIKSTNSEPDSYEYTFKGLSDYFSMFMEKAIEKYGQNVTEPRLYEIVLRESRELIHA